MSEKFEPFWMVYLEGADRLSPRYFTHDEARQEANRLLAGRTGLRVYMLTCHSVGQVESSVVWRYV